MNLFVMLMAFYASAYNVTDAQFATTSILIVYIALTSHSLDFLIKIMKNKDAQYAWILCRSYTMLGSFYTFFESRVHKYLKG